MDGFRSRLKNHETSGCWPHILDWTSHLTEPSNKTLLFSLLRPSGYVHKTISTYRESEFRQGSPYTILGVYPSISSRALVIFIYILNSELRIHHLIRAPFRHHQIVTKGEWKVFGWPSRTTFIRSTRIDHVSQLFPWICRWWCVTGLLFSSGMGKGRHFVWEFTATQTHKK